MPSHDKWAAYGGYSKSNDSENHDRNAIPGPSHPNNGRHDNDRSNSCTNMTPQYKQRQDNDPDDLDDSLSTDGTYRPSRSSRDETSDSYPSSKTEDRDRCRRQSHSSNQTQFDKHRRHHGRRTHDHGHDSPSDSPSSLSDRGRWYERHRNLDDHRSSQRHSRSARTCRSTRERSIPSHTPSYNEWRHDDDTHEDQYEAELLRCYKGLIHDRVGHEREALPDIRTREILWWRWYRGIWYLVKRITTLGPSVQRNWTPWG